MSLEQTGVHRETWFHNSREKEQKLLVIFRVMSFGFELLSIACTEAEGFRNPPWALGLGLVSDLVFPLAQLSPVIMTCGSELSWDTIHCERERDLYFTGLE